MADEFAKGLGIVTAAGLGWLAISAWLTTPGFEDTQLIAPPPEDPGTYEAAALVLREVLMWFAILGMITFWVIIPAINKGRELRAARAAGQ